MTSPSPSIAALNCLGVTVPAPHRPPSTANRRRHGLYVRELVRCHGARRLPYLRGGAMTPLQRRSCYLVVAPDGCVHDRIHVLNRSGSGVRGRPQGCRRPERAASCYQIRRTAATRDRRPTRGTATLARAGRDRRKSLSPQFRRSSTGPSSMPQITPWNFCVPQRFG